MVQYENWGECDKMTSAQLYPEQIGRDGVRQIVISITGIAGWELVFKDWNEEMQC